MNRALTFLRQEVLWGKMAGVAAAAALASQLLPSVPVLESFTLLSFTVAGIVVERMARRHPFWNSLACGLLTTFFEVAIYLLALLGGEEQAMPSLSEVGVFLLLFGIPTIPLTLIGTGMVVLARRITARTRPAQGDQKQAQPPARAGKEAPRPAKETPRSPAKPARPRKEPVQRPGQKKRGG